MIHIVMFHLLDAKFQLFQCKIFNALMKYLKTIPEKRFQDRSIQTQYLLNYVSNGSSEVLKTKEMRSSTKMLFDHIKYLMFHV